MNHASFAQSVSAFRYQAVLHQSSGYVLSNQEVNIRISILQDNAGGTMVYQETHTAETNPFGLINLAIGTGTVLTGDLTGIYWGSSCHYMRIEVDTTDGDNFYDMGTIQLLSVPYALYAKDVSTVEPEDTIHWNAAYGWGNHALSGYLTGYMETDPVFGLSTASDILGSQILNWDTAYSWGNHSTSGYLKSENDPKVGSLGLNYLPKWNGSALENSSIFETATGNIGIGTSSPQEKLHVSENMITDTTYATVFSSNSPLLFQTNGITRIYVSDQTGNMGIGTLTPTERLDVQDHIQANEGFIVNGNYGKYRTVNQITAFNEDSLKYRTIIYSGGIIIYISDESEWVRAVGPFLLPPRGEPCPGIPSVMYGDQVYNTVIIGDQCWLKENLNIGTMISGTQGGQPQTNNGIIEKYCYNNEADFCAVYGGLYEWTEMMQYDTAQGTQGICPEGWHIPTDNEWKILEGTVDSQYPVGDPEWDDSGWRGLDAGDNLKEEGTTHWFSPNTGATNSSGFTGLPGGLRYRYWYESIYAYLGSYGYFWSSLQDSSDYSWFRRLSYNNTCVERFRTHITDGISVRCLKDCWPEPDSANAGPDQINVPGISTTLAGNIPTYGTGVWHIISGIGGIVADTTSPTSAFTGVTDSTYFLTWTITTQCGSSSDTVVISFAGSMGQPCPGISTVEYEGQVYNTVQIGEQCWFRENLNVGTKINSTAGGYQQTNNGTIEKYCYINIEANCDIYGGLYEGPEAMQYVTTEGAQGICPPGWHIPTVGEWNTLSDYLGGSSVAGGKMKSTGTIEAGTGLWHDPNIGATNESGFSGLPGGYRGSYSGSFNYLGYNGDFWSTSQGSTIRAWYRSLYHYYAYVSWGYDDKDYGFSVRCLQDCWPQPDSANAGPDQINVPGTSTTLAGNTPEYGTGVWHIISGTGGLVADTTNPTSTFTGVADSTYSLTWTITTQCGSSVDTVVISFAVLMGHPCPGTPTVEYEGQTYNTVQIGNQCWFKENLNVGMKINSTQTGFQQQDNDTIEKYCYNNDEANCAVYGGLYEWPEAMQYVTVEGAQGICPAGWHVPSDNEWKILEGTVDSQYPVGHYIWNNTIWRGWDAGSNLKEEGTIHWWYPNAGAANLYGFTALGGGIRLEVFDNLTRDGYFWSSTQAGNSSIYRRMTTNYTKVERMGMSKSYGLSVRCLKDE